MGSAVITTVAVRQSSGPNLVSFGEKVIWRCTSFCWAKEGVSARFNEASLSSEFWLSLRPRLCLFLARCVTLGKSHKTSEPAFACLQTGKVDTYLSEMLGVLQQITESKHIAWGPADDLPFLQTSVPLIHAMTSPSTPSGRPHRLEMRIKPYHCKSHKAQHRGHLHF